MDPAEYGAVRDLTIAAFDDEPTLGDLLDALRSSWAWDDSLSFVAVDAAGELVGHILYTGALLDARRRLVDVLVLGPSVSGPTSNAAASGRR